MITGRTNEVAKTAIEQDADVVMFLYRDVVYNDSTADRDAAELIVAKHRSGRPGVIELRFNGRYTRFADPPPKQPK